MKEGETHTAIRASLEAKKKAAEKPRLVTGMYDNLIEMPKFEFITGKKHLSISLFQFFIYICKKYSRVQGLNT